MNHKFKTETGLISDHPAVIMWKALGHPNANPKSIDRLSGTSNNKSTIYRLNGITNEGESIIAKRSSRNTLIVEKYVYEHLLPSLSLDSLKFYGFSEENDLFGWIFLEEAKGSPYIESNPLHRKAASNWLAKLHLFTVDFIPSDEISKIGTERYFEYLQYAYITISDNLENSLLTKNNKDCLHNLLKQLNFIRAKWKELDAFCQTIKPTYVHGDFISKNVIINEDKEIRVLVMDWEASGWGIAGEDIGGLDLDEYWSVINKSILFESKGQLEKLSDVGLLFRYLAWIHPTTYGLNHDWIEQTMNDLNTYSENLSDVIERLDWL